LAQYKILVVDDSSLMRHLIVGLMVQDPQFYVVGTASNGQEALDRIIELQPDLVTMDLEMPEMDGLIALDHFMTYYPVPVVMINCPVVKTNHGCYKAALFYRGE
jgi:chemotaxis response regulator CheB